MKGRLLLNIVIGQSAAIFELLAGEDQTLLVRWDTLLVCARWSDDIESRQQLIRLALDLGLHIVDGV